MILNLQAGNPSLACGSNVTNLVYEIEPVLTIIEITQEKDSSQKVHVNSKNTYTVKAVLDNGQENTYSIDYYFTDVGSNTVTLSSSDTNFFVPSVIFCLYQMFI